MKKKFIPLLAGLVIGILLTLQYKAASEKIDKDKEKEEIKDEVVSIKWRVNHFKLSKDNLLNELVAQDVQFPEIVLAQAVLETGHFKSHACVNKNNLFGLRNNNGTYMSFNHWTDAVAAYKKYIQKWDNPPNDYYQFLEQLGYAEDKSYVKKVKEIVRQNNK